MEVESVGEERVHQLCLVAQGAGNEVAVVERLDNHLAGQRIQLGDAVRPGQVGLPHGHTYFVYG